MAAYNGLLATTLNVDGADALSRVTAGGAFDAVFATSGESFFTGHALHFVNGIVFGLLYGILFRELLPQWKRTNGGNIALGLFYSVIMSIISAGLLVPYAYVPNQGYGLFLFDGPDGWKLPFAILVWHLIYGFFLGALYQPTEVDPADEYAHDASSTTRKPSSGTDARRKPGFRSSSKHRPAAGRGFQLTDPLRRLTSARAPAQPPPRPPPEARSVLQVAGVGEVGVDAVVGDRLLDVGDRRPSRGRRGR